MPSVCMLKAIERRWSARREQPWSASRLSLPRQWDLAGGDFKSRCLPSAA